MALQDRPDARGGDRDAHGGELTVDAAVTPGWILLRESEDKRGGSFAVGRATRVAMGIRPAFGNKVAMPTQQGCRLDEETPESTTGEQS